MRVSIDAVHKKFPDMASLSFEERHEKGNVHFHVRFYFFGNVPADLEKRLGAYVFARWQALSPSRLYPEYNLLSRSKYEKRESLEYLLKYIEPVRALPWIPGQHYWWVKRKTEIFLSNWTPVNKKTVDEILNRKSRKESKLPDTAPITQRKPTMRDVEYMKAYLETTGSGQDWEELKRRNTGSKKRVSDADFLRYIQGAAKPSKLRKSAKQNTSEDTSL